MPAFDYKIKTKKGTIESVDFLKSFFLFNEKHGRLYTVWFDDSTLEAVSRIGDDDLVEVILQTYTFHTKEEYNLIYLSPVMGSDAIKELFVDEFFKDEVGPFEIN